MIAVLKFILVLGVCAAVIYALNRIFDHYLYFSQRITEKVREAAKTKESMKTSSINEVKALYEETAESYSKILDSEIELPIYSDTLSRLSDRITDIPGDLVDTSCGSGHMLWLYQSRYDSKRSLIGIDMSIRSPLKPGKKPTFRCIVVQVRIFRLKRAFLPFLAHGDSIFAKKL